MKALKWRQVHAWRLAQHGLSPRFSQRDFVKAVTLTGGIQAQVMSAAELAFCTRVEGLCSEDVKSALWQDRTLVKTWAMRGTLHVLSASELPLYVAARGFNDEADNWTNYFAEYGISPAQQKAFLAAVPHHCCHPGQRLHSRRLAIRCSTPANRCQGSPVLLTHRRDPQRD